MASAERPVLGGRQVDENGINSGLLRCPRCLSRIVSKCGQLTERQGTEAIMWVPRRPPAEADTDAEVADDAWDWTEQPQAWWWALADMNQVDNGGLSRVVPSPGGRIKLVMCMDCNYGPFGYQREDDPQLWICCDMLHQQDPSLANDADDFQLPPGLDLSTLEGLIASGAATVQFHVTFSEQRLGMQLMDAADGTGVEVAAFTELDGQLGPAEQSGRIAAGDVVARVNGRSTQGLDYAAVLDMVIEAARPVTLHFERRGSRAQGAQGALRVQHKEWKPPRDEVVTGGGP